MVAPYKGQIPKRWKASAVERLGARWVLMGLALVMPACIPEGLAFVQDDRLEITSPEGRTEVELPLTIEWEVEDFEITGPDGNSDPSAGYFGVFVDTTPVPPGKDLAWVARDDNRCINTPGCPDETYLADRNIFSTSETSFTIENLPDLDTASGRETHEVTVVLLDGTGNRIGENAWYVTFFYDREGDS